MALVFDLGMESEESTCKAMFLERMVHRIRSDITKIGKENIDNSGLQNALQKLQTLDTKKDTVDNSKDSGTDDTKKLLLCVLDTCATHKINNRPLVRDILTVLYSISGKIDREVLYWDYKKQDVTTQETLEIKSKQEYILEQVAGWSVNLNDQPWMKNVSADFYLDLPFAKASSEDGETQVLPDALYHQQDPALVLTLLRYGVTPSCLYLWPVAMTIDLRLAISGPDTKEDISGWNEMQYIRYFCRARPGFVLQVVLGDDKDNACSNASYDDTLLITPRTQQHIPSSRYRSPASLQHHCRLSVRTSLLEADNLPRGITELPLPRTILRYVDLLED